MIHRFLIVCIIGLGHALSGQNHAQQWVDSVYESLTLKQKVGQLFMIAAYSNKSKEHIVQVESLIKKYHVGGLIFMQNDAQIQLNLTNRFQSMAKTPLLLGMDAEWGVSMRLDNTFLFPWAITLAATRDESLTTKVAEQIALQNASLGIHFNFSPVVDVNTNPNNPIIGGRAFSSDKELVAQMGVAYMKGLHNQNILACAKHFPGHGDTSKDSHTDLPSVLHGKERLFDLELYPFKHLINNNVDAIMVAHLNVPALEPNPKIPSSLSHKVVTELLKKTLGYKGLIVTDALNMQGVAKYYPPGQVDYMAFMAGNDILLFSENVPVGVEKILKGIQSGKISMGRLEESVKKILWAKFRAGLHQKVQLSQSGLMDALNSNESKMISQQVYRQSATLVADPMDLIPLQTSETIKIGYLKMGTGDSESFLKALKKHAQIDQIQPLEANYTYQALEPYQYIIIGYHQKTDRPYKNQALSVQEKALIEKIKANHFNVNVVVFGSPYLLKDFKEDSTLIMAYQNNIESQQVIPELIFGQIPFRGRLPVDVNDVFKFDRGIIKK